jgi:AraC-like DNA-binding protein
MAGTATEKAAKKPVSFEDIDAQIAKLKEKRRLLQAKRSERITKSILKAAEESGLSDLEIADEKLREAFGEIVGRFRPAEPTAAPAAD